MKTERDIVLLCNPRAGGRWQELAKILDSDEAHGVRRIVTDDIEDLGAVIDDLGHRVRLLCIYGGDGTIQKIITDLYARKDAGPPAALALIGGGTMNVTARWLGFGGSPGENFREVVRRYRADRLFFREVPLLEIRQGPRRELGFTFSVGPAVRILDRYEQGNKTKIGALGMLAASAVAVFARYPREYANLLETMRAEVSFDGERLPHDRFATLFCNVTGHVEIGVHPFNHERTRETFHALAYAVDPKEIITLLPFLALGKLPIDPKVLLQPTSGWRQVGMSYLGRGTLPLDPRYINRPISRATITTDESVFTIDGEILRSSGDPIELSLGPTVRLAASPQLGPLTAK